MLTTRKQSKSLRNFRPFFSLGNAIKTVFSQLIKNFFSLCPHVLFCYNLILSKQKGEQTLTNFFNKEMRFCAVFLDMKWCQGIHFKWVCISSQLVAWIFPEKYDLFRDHVPDAQNVFNEFFIRRVWPDIPSQIFAIRLLCRSRWVESFYQDSYSLMTLHDYQS